MTPVDYRRLALRAKVSRAPRIPNNWSRDLCFAMLFCLNPKENPWIEKMDQFLFFQRCLYKFFQHTTRVSQLSRVIYQSWSMDAFNSWPSEWCFEVQRFKHGETTISFTPRCDRSKSLKSHPLVLSSSSSSMGLYYFRSVSLETTNKSTLWR